MGRRKSGLGGRAVRVSPRVRVSKERLDYHEGLSANQVEIILREFGLGDKLGEFNEWLYGQTCPVVPRWIKGGIKEAGGVYEYDLFRWIESKKAGIEPVWD